LVEALLGLNKYKKEADKSPLVEVVVMSRNSPDTGLMILNNIRKKGVDITRSVFTGGETVVDYLEAFNVDLSYNQY
jgi:5'-nucleotidase